MTLNEGHEIGKKNLFFLLFLCTFPWSLKQIVWNHDKTIEESQLIGAQTQNRRKTDKVTLSQDGDREKKKVENKAAGEKNTERKGQIYFSPKS